MGVQSCVAREEALAADVPGAAEHQADDLHGRIGRRTARPAADTILLSGPMQASLLP